MKNKNLKFLSLIRLFLVAGIAVTISASCESLRESPAGERLLLAPGEGRETPPSVLVDDEAASGIVEYLPVEELQAQYGTGPENPFVAPRALLTPLEIMAFRFTFTDMEPGTIIEVTDTEFRFAGQSDTPIPQNTLIRFWNNQETTDELRATEVTQRDALIRREVYEGDVRAGDEPVSGMLIYLGRYADFGPAELRFPIVDSEGNEVTYLSVEFELD